MTPTEQALAFLREQLGDGWDCRLCEPFTRAADHGPRWVARAGHGDGEAGVEVEAAGDDPVSAAQACVAAAQEAGIESAAERELQDALSKRMGDLLTRTANALKGEPKPLHLHDWSDLPSVAEAERSLADRLAEALRRARPIVAGFNVNGALSVVVAALAEHAARRSGGEKEGA